MPEIQHSNGEYPMAKPTTFETVADIISATRKDLPRDRITPKSHALNDLGLDSLGFLDAVFAIDSKFGITVPIEQWTQDVNDGKTSSDKYFVLDGLCENIDKLVAEKAAGTGPAP